MLLAGLIQRIGKGRSHVLVQGYARGPLRLTRWFRPDHARWFGI